MHIVQILFWFLGVKMYYILFLVVLLTNLPCISMDLFGEQKTRDLHLFVLGLALHSAIDRGDNNKVQQIIEQEPAAVNAKSKGGSTPVDLALRNNRFDVAKLLLEKGGKVSDIGPKLLENENKTVLLLPYISKKNVESAEAFFKLKCQRGSRFASGDDKQCAHMQKLLSMVQAEFNKNSKNNVEKKPKKKPCIQEINIYF
jgi:ankyrin repeat protein